MNRLNPESCAHSIDPESSTKYPVLLPAQLCSSYQPTEQERKREKERERERKGERKRERKNERERGSEGGGDRRTASYCSCQTERESLYIEKEHLWHTLLAAHTLHATARAKQDATHS